MMTYSVNCFKYIQVYYEAENFPKITKREMKLINNNAVSYISFKQHKLVEQSPKYYKLMKFIKFASKAERP